MSVMRRLTVILATLLLGGCFKSVVTYTSMGVAVYNQTASNADYTRAKDLDAYAYYVDTLDWGVANYDDAVAGRITSKLTGEVLDTPDVIASFNSAQEYQLSLVLNEPLAMIVIVNPTLKLYAYRSYTLPVNLPEVYAKLYMASWRPSHTASGWIVVNNFYTAPSEALSSESFASEALQGKGVVSAQEQINKSQTNE